MFGYQFESQNGTLHPSIDLLPPRPAPSPPVTMLNGILCNFGAIKFRNFIRIFFIPQENVCMLFHTQTTRSVKFSHSLKSLPTQSVPLLMTAPLVYIGDLKPTDATAQRRRSHSDLYSIESD